MRAAHQAGFEAVEFDVMLAADGVPVLMHDESVDRTTSGRGAMRDFDSAALARLDAGARFGAAFAGEPVPTFDATARLCNTLGLKANVEIKPLPGAHAETGRVVAAMARRMAAGARTPPLLSSFSEAALAAARDESSELPRALLFDAVPPDWQQRLVALQCIGLHCNAETLEPGLARRIVAAGYALAAWTVNDIALAERLFAMGVDAIFTDRLDLFAGFEPKPANDRS